MNSFLQSLKSFFLNSIPHKITFFSLIFLLLSTQCHSQDFAATAKEVVVDAVEDLTQNPATPVGTTIKVAGAIGLTIKAVGDAVGLAQDTNNTNNNTNTNNTEVHSINGKPVSGKVDVIVNNGSYSAEEPTDGIQHDESNPILTQIGGATPNPQPEDPKKPDDRNDKLVFEKCCKKHIESSDHKRQGLFEKGGQDIDNTAKEIIKRVHKNMKLPNGHTTIRCKINNNNFDIKVFIRDGNRVLSYDAVPAHSARIIEHLVEIPGNIVTLPEVNLTTFPAIIPAAIDLSATDNQAVNTPNQPVVHPTNNGDGTNNGNSTAIASTGTKKPTISRENPGAVAGDSTGTEIGGMPKPFGTEYDDNIKKKLDKQTNNLFAQGGQHNNTPGQSQAAQEAPANNSADAQQPNGAPAATTTNTPKWTLVQTLHLNTDPINVETENYGEYKNPVHTKDTPNSHSVFYQSGNNTVGFRVSVNSNNLPKSKTKYVFVWDEHNFLKVQDRSSFHTRMLLTYFKETHPLANIDEFDSNYINYIRRKINESDPNYICHVLRHYKYYQYEPFWNYIQSLGQVAEDFIIAAAERLKIDQPFAKYLSQYKKHNAIAKRITNEATYLLIQRRQQEKRLQDNQSTIQKAHALSTQLATAQQPVKDTEKHAATLPTQQQQPTPTIAATTQPSRQPLGFAWSTSSGLAPMSEQQLKDLEKGFSDPSAITLFNGQFNSGSNTKSTQLKPKQALPLDPQEMGSMAKPFGTAYDDVIKQKLAATIPQGPLFSTETHQSDRLTTEPLATHATPTPASTTLSQQAQNLEKRFSDPSTIVLFSGRFESGNNATQNINSPAHTPAAPAQTPTPQGTVKVATSSHLPVQSPVQQTSTPRPPTSSVIQATPSIQQVPSIPMHPTNIAIVDSFLKKIEQADRQSDINGLPRPSSDPRIQATLQQITEITNRYRQNNQNGHTQGNHSNNTQRPSLSTKDATILVILICYGLKILWWLTKKAAVGTYRILRSPLDTYRYICATEKNLMQQATHLDYHIPYEDLKKLSSPFMYYHSFKAYPTSCFTYSAVTLNLQELQEETRKSFQTIPTVVHLLSLPLLNFELIQTDSSMNTQALSQRILAYDTATSALPGKAGNYIVRELHECAGKIVGFERQRRDNIANLKHHIDETPNQDWHTLDSNQLKQQMDASLAAYREELIFAQKWEMLRQTLDHPLHNAQKTFYLKQQSIKNTWNSHSADYGTISLTSFESHTGSPLQLNIFSNIAKLVDKALEPLITNYSDPYQINKNLLTKQLALTIINYLFISASLNSANNFNLVFAIQNFCSKILELEEKINPFFQNANKPLSNAFFGIFKSTQNNQYYVEHFVETLYAGLQQQSQNAINQDLATATNQLAGIICLACANSPATRTLFLTNTTNTQPTAANAVELVTKMLLQQTIQNNQQQNTQILENLKKIINEEQALLQIARQKKYNATNLFAPISYIFESAIKKALPEVAKQQQDTTKRTTTTTIVTNIPTTSTSSSTPQSTIPIPQTPIDDLAQAIQASLNDVSQQDKMYSRLSAHAQPTNAEQAITLINQCDQENKSLTFNTPHPHNLPIIQLPALYQFYPALEFVPEYGDDDFVLFCGFYAAYFAEVFANNPNASHTDLINLLNNRHDFEQQMLIPGKKVVQAFRGQNSETNANLLGEEIEHILSNSTRLSTIVVGAVQQRTSINESQVQKTARLVHSFKHGQRPWLIWIIPSEHLNHWITVLVRRNANQAVEMVIADSIGMDRRVMQDIQEIYQSVTSPNTSPTPTPPQPTTSSTASSTSTQQFNPSTSATPSSHNNAHTNDEQEENDDVQTSSSTSSTTNATTQSPTRNNTFSNRRHKRPRADDQSQDEENSQKRVCRRSPRLAELRDRMKAKRQREETKKTADKKTEKKTCRHPVEANDQ